MQRAKPEGVTRLGLFGSEDAAKALCLLAPGASMTGDLDQHVGFWDVNGVVTYFGQEHSVHLHHSIMIITMHANTCLIGADHVVTDDVHSWRRAMCGLSTDSQLQPVTACTGSSVQTAYCRHAMAIFSIVWQCHASCPAETS